MTAVDTAAALATQRPASGLPATEPPEARGLERDQVRLLVAGEGVLRHVLFRDLGAYLSPGDALVVNTSATLPAAVDGRRLDGAPVRAHFCRIARNGWAVELRTPGGGRVTDAGVGEVVQLPGGHTITLAVAYPDTTKMVGSRLWRVHGDVEDVVEFLRSTGRPVTYDYVDGQWPLSQYQTVFGRHPGSAEMPSAARPFSQALVTDVVARGVTVVTTTLHTALSSLESHEEPLPEAYSVPAATAAVVNATRAAGGAVIAVGTTVTRALETVADADGAVHAGAGWTDLVLSPDRPCRVVDGLITGWHDRDASHLQLLEAVVGAQRVARAYEAAVAERYRWHEFGDSCLLLPAGRRSDRPYERP